MDLARHCQDVYTDDYFSMHDNIDMKSTGVQCFFLIENFKLLVVYRGSNEVVDWKMNFALTQTEYPKGSGCYVHSGFLIQWLSVMEIFRRKLTNLLQLHVPTGEIKEVILTGHSAGGQSSLATYACKDILTSFNIPVKNVTFASPRVGDLNFKRELESFADCTRIVLDRDIITRLPLNNYVHVGKPIQIRDNEILERETSNWEHIQWLFMGLKNFDFGLRDHLPFAYYAKIRRIVFDNSR